MGYNDCICPPDAALTTIPAACAFNWRDIYKIGFRRGGQAASADVATFSAAAYWTGLKAAADSTKVVFTPKTWEVTLTASEAVEEPGHDGSQEISGETTPTLTGHFRNLDTDTHVALRKLICEPDADIVLVDNAGNILANDNSAAPTFIKTINKVFIPGGPSREGNASQRIPFTIYLDQDWFAGVKKYTPTDFNAKTFL